MKNLAQFACAMMLCGCASAAETHPNKPPPPLGPLVDVTLQNGESKRGQLLGFSNGEISLKTDSGEVLKRDGAQVLMVKFVATEAVKSTPGKTEPQPSAQATELTEAERKRIGEFRFGEKKLTVEDELEFKRLQAKLDIHIAALEREIKSAQREEDAVADLIDLTKSYLFQGRAMMVIRTLVRGAADSIENEPVKRKVHARMSADMQEVFVKFDERFKLNRPKKNGPFNPPNPPPPNQPNSNAPPPPDAK